MASPQIRNQGTLGGNLAQDTRCWYYRDGWNCYRAGGNICYADTPTAMNREHCILGASRCVAVNPSDTAPALVALDAQMDIRSSAGMRSVPAEQFFVGPDVDIMRMTVLEPNDLLAAVRVPGTWAGARFYFEKSRDRQVWDFALASVASAARITNGVVEDIRIAVNGVAPTPLRLRAAEDAVRGRQLTDEVAAQAGEAAIGGVRPLAHNGYKVALLRNLVTRSVPGRRGVGWNSSSGAPIPGGRRCSCASPGTSSTWRSGPGLRSSRSISSTRSSGCRGWPAPTAREPSRRAAANVPARITRHTAAARYFHWVMAASMIALLITGFFPIVGIQFPWLTIHWVAGVLLTVSIVYHMVHATFFLDFWSIWILPSDLAEAWNRIRRQAGQQTAPIRKHGKYPLDHKLYHLAVTLAGLAVIGTGIVLMLRIDSVFWPRNAYFLADETWGLMYVIHGLGGVLFVTLTLTHVYFAVRPDKFWLTKSMLLGYVDRDRYLEHHDPERWVVSRESNKG